MTPIAQSGRTDRTEQPHTPDAPPALELEGVDVPFGDLPGLRGIDLVIRAGERFVLVGASGAGKSSLLRAIAGSGPMTSGRIRIDGNDTVGRSPRDRGMVLLEQRPLLFPHFTVRGNLAFPLEVRGVSRGEIERRVADALDAVRLPDLGGRMPHTLSGGQAHRVALARAVVARPRVLLLDEPLTSLDPGLRAEMRRAITVVGERYGTALLMVTHDLKEAGHVGERVGVLTDGRTAQVDVPEVLFRNPGSLSVARFIGWRNELPAYVDGNGTIRVGPWTVARPNPSGLREDAPSGVVTLCFGAHGARLENPQSSEGPLVRVTAVRHDPHGVTVEYRVDDTLYLDSQSVEHREARTIARHRSTPEGELEVDAEGAPQVGDTVSLEIFPSRARIFRADVSPLDRTT